MNRILLLLLCLLPLWTDVTGQQLVLLRRQEVILRLNPGDEIVLKVRGEDRIRRSYVNNIYDHAVKLHRDTIPFSKIERLYFKRTRFYNRIGQVLVVGGSGYFLLDQVNTGFGMDPDVTSTSLKAIALGIPLLFIRPRSQKLNHRYRLRAVDSRSVFYR